MSDIKFVFFDIETMSKKKHALVLSAGFVVIDPTVYEDFSTILKRGVTVKFNAKEQVEVGRHVCKDTIENFWMKQVPEARQVLVPSEKDISVKDFYEAIKPLGYVQDARWYCKGPHFDAAILESLFEYFDMRAPWGYNNMRDIRTFLEDHTGSCIPFDDRPDGFIGHDALHDAAADAWTMLRVLHK
jgi:3' exoribonuclease, RNase T-like